MVEVPSVGGGAVSAAGRGVEAGAGAALGAALGAAVSMFSRHGDFANVTKGREERYLTPKPAALVACLRSCGKRCVAGDAPLVWPRDVQGCPSAAGSRKPGATLEDEPRSGAILG
ncbi:hypothetical protein JCM17961_09250 [Endothiovibrio diazotrophicus]